MDADAAQRACFEAGIKFGTLYHQFAGTPVTPESAPALATAIEGAIENQPYCVGVTVGVRTEALTEAVESAPADYVELTGRFLDVEVVVVQDGWRVTGRMTPDDDGYPLMRVADVRRVDDAESGGN
jgi:hypothetical protein